MLMEKQSMKIMLAEEMYCTYNTTDLCWKKIARNLIVSEGKVQDI